MLGGPLLEWVMTGHLYTQAHTGVQTLMCVDWYIEQNTHTLGLIFRGTLHSSWLGQRFPSLIAEMPTAMSTKRMRSSNPSCQTVTKVVNKSTDQLKPDYLEVTP